jgi:chromosome segregation ATPase
MDANIFVELISTLGFPIALVIAMGIFIYKIYNQSVKREEALMEEIRVNRETNSKAIETIAQYSERLETIQSDIRDIKTDITILTAK